MSPPEPEMLQAPLFNDWLPASATVPMSEQLHPAGHPGGGGAVLPTVTVSTVTVLSVVASCEVTATPPSSEVPSASVTDELAIGVQFVPLVEVYALRTFAVSATCRYVGVAPATDTCVTAATPAAFRYWTVTPLRSE